MSSRKVVSNNKGNSSRKNIQQSALKRGWTTGACATAATKAALSAWLTGSFEDPVTITLPKGETPSFALIYEHLNEHSAKAAIIKDAGDDPDVTHGATIYATIKPAKAGTGIHFKAGKGVGIVTKPGLPIGVGEAAINPVPRQMMQEVVEKLCAQHNIAPDFTITIGVENGEALAEQTWNGRLGIKGGLSILGTTGVVHPFSCSAWIHSIHRGVDVARAEGLAHILAATGSTSETAALKLFDLPTHATIDMGDFAGGLLKYLRKHPVPKLTIAGGFAKLTKLAQGAMDLHSARSQVDFEFLSQQAAVKNDKSLVHKILKANTALEVLELSQIAACADDLTQQIAHQAQQQAQSIITHNQTQINIVLVSRQGDILAQTGFSSYAAK